MAIKEFRGDAPAIADVWTVQVTANDAATTYSLTINGKTVSVPGNAGGASDTATDLAAAWNDSTIPEFAEATAVANTDTITITMDTAGVPIEFTEGASGGTGTIGTPSNATPADGPYFWSAANFGGTLPADGDDVYVRGNVSILYGLDQSSIQPDSLICTSTTAGNPVIGLPRVNSLGYVEYRDRFLKIGPTYAKFDANSTRLNVDTGSDQTAIEVYSGTVAIAGSNASSTLEVFGGTVGVAAATGQAAQFTTIAVGGSSNVTISDGVTVATVSCYGTARVSINCAATTLVTQGSPSVTVDGSGAIGTANVRGGTVDYRSSGTITTLNGGGGTIDFRNNLSGVTVTNANVSKGFTIDDSSNRVTWTNAYVIQNANLGDITHRTGRNVTVKVTAT